MIDTPRVMLSGKRHHGYIVLVSVIILGVVLLLIAQTVSTTGYFQRLGAQDFELKEESYFVAYACIDRALFNLSDDLDYAGNETKTIGQYTCTIDPITLVANPPAYTAGLYTLVTTRATVRNHTSVLQILADSYLNVVFFTEL